ncbi:putative monooxygenase p33MONOX [Electrophorus electricus]|uniref:putative monooxygenase p33MONOX n=1 Tax=Electrophorus electricus TaxID=8005 RepID=UPI0015D05B6A|nr:putative monooxygenase p33MONOX [Electrophorus electricus]
MVGEMSGLHSLSIQVVGFQHQHLSRLSHPPHSRKVNLRICASQSPGLFATVSGSNSVDASIHMGGNEGGARGLDRWSLFGMRSGVQKSPTDPGSDPSTSGGFSLHSYLGVQKSTTLDGIKTQINLVVEDPANFKSSEGEVTSVEGKKSAPQRLKHRDMNILTPSGF